MKLTRLVGEGDEGECPTPYATVVALSRLFDGRIIGAMRYDENGTYLGSEFLGEDELSAF